MMGECCSFLEAPSGSGGGGTVAPGEGSGFTAGGILIGASDGSLGQDATTLFWDAASNFLGVGTASPACLLDMTGSVSPAANANGRLARVAGTIVEAGSGTHAMLAGLEVATPTITGGAATVTRTACLSVGAVPTGGTVNYGMYSAGTVATANNISIGSETVGNAFVHLASVNGSNFILIAAGSNCNGVTIGGGGGNITMSVKTIFSGEAEIDGALNHDGTTVGFYGVAPVTQRTAVADPSGGATIDAECRTATIAVITRLEELGLFASA